MRSESEVAGMACPICGVPLAMSDRQGIEIDYCPQCRGVWLDRGELDKIIEKTVAAEAAAAPEPPAPPPAPAPQAAPPPHYPPPPYPQQHGYGDPYYGRKGHYGYKRRKSFLEELFD